MIKQITKRYNNYMENENNWSEIKNNLGEITNKIKEKIDQEELVDDLKISFSNTIGTQGPLLMKSHNSP